MGNAKHTLKPLDEAIRHFLLIIIAGRKPVGVVEDFLRHLHMFGNFKVRFPWNHSRYVHPAAGPRRLPSGEETQHLDPPDLWYQKHFPSLVKNTSVGELALLYPTLGTIPSIGTALLDIRRAQTPWADAGILVLPVAVGESI